MGPIASGGGGAPAESSVLRSVMQAGLQSWPTSTRPTTRSPQQAARVLEATRAAELADLIGPVTEDDGIVDAEIIHERRRRSTATQMGPQSAEEE